MESQNIDSHLDLVIHIHKKNEDFDRARDNILWIILLLETGDTIKTICSFACP